MPIVEVNGQEIEFPDEMAPDQIKAVLQQKFPPQPSVPQEGLGRTVFDQGMQGATFGFADEVTDRIGAAGASLLTGQNYGDLLKEARSLTSERQARQLDQRPVASITSNIAGGLLTGGAGATTKAGASVGNFVRSGNTASRIAKGALAGAASGGLYGAGTAEDGGRLEGASTGAKYGAAFGGALPAAGAGLKKLNTKVSIPNSEQVREKGSQAFQLAEQKGGALSAGEANKFYNKILNIRPQTLEGSVFKGESPVSKILDNVETLKNRPMTLKAAMEIDSALGDLAYSTMDTFGKLSSDGKKFLDMQGHLRSVIDNADERVVHGGKEGFEALKEARKYWSTSLRMREIERIIEKARDKEQPVTILKNGFKALLSRGDRLKGYTPAEVKAIQHAAKTGVVTDVIKLAGSGLIPVGSGVTGLAGGPIGGAVGFATGAAVQQGAKALGVARQMGRSNKALKTIAEKSGMVETTSRVKIPASVSKQIGKMKPAEARLFLEKYRQTKQ